MWQCDFKINTLDLAADIAARAAIFAAADDWRYGIALGNSGIL